MAGAAVKTTGRTLTIAATALALGLVGYGVSQAETTPDPGPGQGPPPAVASATSSDGYTVVESKVESRPCDLEAVPILAPDLDPRVARSASVSPFSKALNPADALDRNAAAAQAVGGSSDPASVTKAAATRLPYSLAGPLVNGGSNPLIAASRCIWVVTVDGPLELDSQRAGAVNTPVYGYTVAIDAASGEAVAGQGGDGTPSLITGAGTAN